MSETFVGMEIHYKWFEEGGAIIRVVDSGFDLYEVPQYGGEERYIARCATLAEAKSIADRWT